MTTDQITAVKDEYEPLILRTMNEWRDVLQSRGHSVSEPFEMHDDCYRWDMAVYPEGSDGSEGNPIADVSVTLAESKHYDGSTVDDDSDDSEGVNVIMDVVSFGGRILGGFSPHNYSPRVWTDDLDDIHDRMQALANIDGEEIADSVDRAEEH